MKTFEQQIDKLSKLYPVLPKKAGILAVNFFKNRFRKGSWLDKTEEKWEKRKRKSSTNRGILIKSGRLKRSIRVVKTTPNSITIGTNVPYAQIHNEGGSINTSAKIKAHTRQAHTRKRRGRTESVKEYKVKAHTRKISIKMPQRQFMGTSNALDNKIEDMLVNEINNCLK